MICKLDIFVSNKKKIYETNLPKNGCIGIILLDLYISYKQP